MLLRKRQTKEVEETQLKRQTSKTSQLASQLSLARESQASICRAPQDGGAVESQPTAPGSTTD